MASRGAADLRVDPYPNFPAGQKKHLGNMVEPWDFNEIHIHHPVPQPSQCPARLG